MSHETTNQIPLILWKTYAITSLQEKPNQIDSQWDKISNML